MALYVVHKKFEVEISGLSISDTEGGASKAVSSEAQTLLAGLFANKDIICTSIKPVSTDCKKVKELRMFKGTVSGRVFENAQFREGTSEGGKAWKFATFKVSKSNGKDKDGNWKPSTWVSVMIPAHVAAAKDGTPSWLVKALTKGTNVTVTGDEEVTIWKDKTGEAQPQITLRIGSFSDIALQGGGEKPGTSSGGADTASDAPDDDIPF